MEPAGAMDYLVVLGCGIRKDGTPSPLLAGRVDRAREFDAACVKAGGAPATFVPSGGQGPDEVISEAQSMPSKRGRSQIEFAQSLLGPVHEPELFHVVDWFGTLDKASFISSPQYGHFMVRPPHFT